MHKTTEIILAYATVIVFFGIIGWVLFRLLKRWLKRTKQDPTVIIIKLLVTLGIFGIMFWSAVNLGWVAPFAMVACAIPLSLMWAPSLAAALASPITNAIDGGNVAPERRPFYSIARAMRGRGKYSEAVAEIRKQLEIFPTDIEGQMLLAEIQVENLNDLPGAETTLQRLCNQPGHAPRNIALALSTLADWHLKYSQDREAARAEFEKIIELLPNSEFATIASQRIAHLAGTDHLMSPHNRKRFTIAQGIDNMGLLEGTQHVKAAETDPAKLAADYVKHLQEHPLDTEAREKLAEIYADHYGRLDLAEYQFEQLLAQPDQPAKRVIQWLNVLTDIQLRHGADYEKVRETLQRLIDLYPGSAAAISAARRIDYLKLELKGKEKGSEVKLGTYEQDIGLKQSSPHQL